jgi:hypothetical protein
MEDIKNNQLHPCKYCGNTCRGKQCKQCHIKMISRQNECLDCKKHFISLRCDDCNEKHKHKFNKCPECDINYLNISKDGKIFEKCYECYQKGFSNCKLCNNKCFKQYLYCKTCYEKNKETKEINNEYLSDFTDNLSISENSDTSESSKDINNETYVSDSSIDKFCIDDIDDKNKKYKTKCITKTCGNETHNYYCIECMKTYKLKTFITI